MRIVVLASASIAAAMAIALVDAAPADAAQRKIVVRKVQKLSVAKTPARQSHVLRHMKRVQKLDKKPTFVKTDTPKLITAKPLLKKGVSPVLLSAGGSHLKLGKAGKLPLFKPVAATATLKGRV